jgi:hypothetical protein
MEEEKKNRDHIKLQQEETCKYKYQRNDAINGRNTST